MRRALALLVLACGSPAPEAGGLRTEVVVVVASRQGPQGVEMDFQCPHGRTFPVLIPEWQLARSWRHSVLTYRSGTQNGVYVEHLDNLNLEPLALD